MDKLVLHFDLVFNTWTRGVIAELTRSQFDSAAESIHKSLFFVEQNRGVATPPRSHYAILVDCQVGINFWNGDEAFWKFCLRMTTHAALYLVDRTLAESL